MRRLIFILMFMCTTLFAESINVHVKGRVYIVDENETLVQLEEEDVIEDTDIILISEKSSVTFFINDKKIIIRKPGFHNIKDIINKK